MSRSRPKRDRNVRSVGVAAGLALVFAAGVALSWSHWRGPPRWSPDALYYEAQRLELQGSSAQRARALIFFDSPRYRQARVQAFRIKSDPAYARRIWNRPWVDYSARFYRRRWSNSAAAAVLSHWFGIRSLMFVSLAGFIAAGVMLYVLLTLRFNPPISAAVATVALTLTPVRLHSFIALTDSWGLALLALSLFVSYRIIVSSARWLVVLVPLVTVLGLTRDNWVIIVVAGAVLGLYGHVRGWLISAAALVAALPVLLTFPVPLREELAYTLNRYQPTTEGWGFIAGKYPTTLVHAQLVNGLYVVRHPITGAFFVLGLTLVLLGARRADPYLQLMIASIVGGALFLMINPNWDATQFRFELVLLPAAAAGIASAGTFVAARSTRLRTATTGVSPGR